MSTRQIGRYRVEADLARQPGARSFLARDERLDRPVLLRVSASHADETAARVRLAHPCHAALLDALEHEGRGIQVLEPPEGPRLAEALEMDGPLPLPRALDLGRQLLRALAHAHERGVGFGGPVTEDLHLGQGGGITLVGRPRLCDAPAREDLPAAVRLLARCVGPAAPPGLARLLAAPEEAGDCAELLARLDDPLLLAREATGTGAPEEPSPASELALGSAYVLLIAGGAVAPVPLAAASALAALGALVLGERRHALFALLLGALALLSGWLVPG